MDIRARESVRQIVGALMDGQATALAQPSLAEGTAGVVLALTFIGRCLHEPALQDAAAVAWNDTVEKLAQGRVAAGLFSGFCGVGWVDAVLAADPGDAVNDDAVHEELERVLLAHLELGQNGQGAAVYDLVSGLVGFGVYALERGRRGRAPEIIRAVVEELIARSVQQKVGCAWLSPPSPYWRAGAHQRDLGIAHGVPGVIAFLARANKAGELSAQGKSTLEGAVAWLLHCKRELAFGLNYPSAVGAEEAPPDPDDCRVAWCYGDLSVAAALAVAGECCGRPDWSSEALATALRCTRVPIESTRVVDHGLCHGAAGVAHVLARMATMFRSAELQAAAQGWLRRTLEMRSRGTGIAGYARMRPRNPFGTTAAERDYYLSVDPGFLMGAAGVALVLAASVSEVDPAWDRVLLVSC